MSLRLPFLIALLAAIGLALFYHQKRVAAENRLRSEVQRSGYKRIVPTVGTLVICGQEDWFLVIRPGDQDYYEAQEKRRPPCLLRQGDGSYWVPMGAYVGQARRGVVEGWNEI